MCAEGSHTSKYREHLGLNVAKMQGKNRLGPLFVTKDRSKGSVTDFGLW